MKLLIVSDQESSYLYDYFDKDKFSNIDLILSCGDLKSSYLSYLVTMINAPLFYVHGNHDDHYAQKPPEGCQSIDGKLVVFQGLRILGVGGSRKYREGLHQYTEMQMAFKIANLYPKLMRHNGIDILLTHSPALGLGDGKDLIHTGFPQFNKLLDRYEPKYYFHGHQHLNYGYSERVIKYGNTTIINGFGYQIIEY